MYAVHLRLIVKPVVGFLFVLIELFVLGVTSEVLRANWKSAFLRGGLVSAKISGRRGRPHQPFFCSVRQASESLTTLSLTVFTFVADVLQVR